MLGHRRRPAGEGMTRRVSHPQGSPCPSLSTDPHLPDPSLLTGHPPVVSNLYNVHKPLRNGLRSCQHDGAFSGR